MPAQKTSPTRTNKVKRLPIIKTFKEDDSPSKTQNDPKQNKSEDWQKSMVNMSLAQLVEFKDKIANLQQETARFDRLYLVHGGGF